VRRSFFSEPSPFFFCPKKVPTPLTRLQSPLGLPVPHLILHVFSNLHTSTHLVPIIHIVAFDVFEKPPTPLFPETKFHYPDIGRYLIVWQPPFHGDSTCKLNAPSFPNRSSSIPWSFFFKELTPINNLFTQILSPPPPFLPRSLYNVQVLQCQVTSFR